MSTTKTITCEFFVDGMHCAACEMLIEKKFAQHSKINSVSASLATSMVVLELSENVQLDDIREELNQLIAADGYKLLSAKREHSTSWGQLLNALAIASVIFVAFLALQKLGIADLVNVQQLNLPFIFLIGIIASLSTCMAVVGGLVLSISGNYAKEKRTRPMLLFHISRLVSFFIFGGVIGILGATVALTAGVTFVLNLVLFGVMLILGLNLLDVIPALQGWQLRIPKRLGKLALKLEDTQNIFTPVLLGAVTFILPCGFTQSMQLYALTTGNFLTGASTMLVFALGTLPVLGLISFASAKFSQTLQSGLFYKTAGFIVLFFAALNLHGALMGLGII